MRNTVLRDSSNHGEWLASQRTRSLVPPVRCLRGIPPTNNHVTFTFTSTDRVADGRIVESRSDWWSAVNLLFDEDEMNVFGVWEPYLEPFYDKVEDKAEDSEARLFR